jgi:hypothetical protein
MTTLSQCNVWQISAGTGSRTYASTFLRFGVGLIGPGFAGRWAPESDDERFEGPFTRKLASEVKEGDIFLLRTSALEVCAVGLVASAYQFLEQFDDVNGWDLRHARRVRWFRLPSPYRFQSSPFGPRPTRFSGVFGDEAIRFARGIVNSPPDDWKTAALGELPPVEPLLTEVPEKLRDIIGSIQDLQALYDDPHTLGGRPLEAEMVCHCVVPLLCALGWHRFHIAVEWNKIDVAVFHSLPRNVGNCRFVIEAKNFGEGIEGASAQAKGYMDGLGIRCNLLVTDGIRYKLYDPNHLDEAVAYANLWEPKQSALDLFAKLSRNQNA